MSLTISTENQNQPKTTSNRTTEKRMSEDGQRNRNSEKRISEDEEEGFNCNNEYEQTPQNHQFLTDKKKPTLLDIKINECLNKFYELMNEYGQSAGLKKSHF